MDSLRIQRMVHDINRYLASKQQADTLWEQVEMHLQTSYMAERLGHRELVPKHLDAVARLIVQANYAQQQVQQHLPAPR